MTTREYFNKINAELEDINKIRPLIENIHGELAKEICK